ncbi:hypothetical protein PAPHI01_0995 [Pancytospora philotis]|nr:hypothetical protein PAPHI01_0995 [Pancytospora philotis]
MRRTGKREGAGQDSLCSSENSTNLPRQVAAVALTEHNNWVKEIAVVLPPCERLLPVSENAILLRSDLAQFKRARKSEERSSRKKRKRRGSSRTSEQPQACVPTEREEVDAPAECNPKGTDDSAAYSLSDASIIRIRLGLAFYRSFFLKNAVPRAESSAALVLPAPDGMAGPDVGADITSESMGADAGAVAEWEAALRRIYDVLELRPSRIHGLGIFTPVRIPKRTPLMRYEGEIIGKCMSDKRERCYLRNGIQSVYMFTVNKDMVIDATLVGNKARYINHSCDPNCYSSTYTRAKQVVYYAARCIEPGEELLIDYHINEDEPTEKCLCGAASCRFKDS